MPELLLTIKSSRILPSARRTARNGLTPAALRPRRLRIERQLRPQGHNPRMLQQLGRRRALSGIDLEALLKEIDAVLAELVFAGELGRDALSDVVHDGPLV